MDNRGTAKIYIIGSLRNSEVLDMAASLRDIGYDVFDDFMAAGPNADDHWRDYEKQRGHNFKQALKGYAARHVFEYDRQHLDESDMGVVLWPAGKSCHIEAGYLIGQGKPVYLVYGEDPERFDVMACFFTDIFETKEELVETLANESISQTAPER